MGDIAQWVRPSYHNPRPLSNESIMGRHIDVLTRAGIEGEEHFAALQAHAAAKAERNRRKEPMYLGASPE